MRWGAAGEGADTGSTWEGTELMLSARMALPSGTREKLHLSPSWGRQGLPLRSGSMASLETLFDSASWGCEIFKTPLNKGRQALIFTDRETEVQLGLHSIEGKTECGEYSQ